MNNLFRWQHLKDVRSGYFLHMWYAIKLSTHALLIPITGYIHAFFPFLFPALPHKFALRQVAMAEELFEELKKIIEEEEKAKNNG
jgi:hypothetical protein